MEKLIRTCRSSGLTAYVVNVAAPNNFFYNSSSNIDFQSGDDARQVYTAIPKHHVKTITEVKRWSPGIFYIILNTGKENTLKKMLFNRGSYTGTYNMFRFFSGDRSKIKLTPAYTNEKDKGKFPADGNLFTDIFSYGAVVIKPLWHIYFGSCCIIR